MHVHFRFRTDNKYNILRNARNKIQGLNSLRCWLWLSVDFSHWDHALLINNNNPLAALLVAPLHHVELELLESLLELYDALIRTEARLLVRAHVHRVVSPLEIDEELLAPADRAMPLDIAKHLLHALLLFVVVC